MNGAGLRDFLETSGLSLDQDTITHLAKGIGIAPVTLKHNLKPSQTVPEQIERGLHKYVSDLREKCRTTLRETNLSQLSHSNLSVFHKYLPQFGVKEFGGFPHLFTERQGKGNGIRWDDCLTAFLRRSANASDRKAVLMGDPGSGKSTILKRMLIEVSENKDFTPVFLPAGVYNSDASPLRTILDAVDFHYTHVWQWPEILPFRSFLENEASQGRLVVFLDSFDEAPFERRRNLVGQIRGSRLPILVSSRYCEPEIEGADRFTNTIFHLGALEISDAISHIAALKDLIDDSAASSSKQTVTVLSDIEANLRELRACCGKILDSSQDLPAPNQLRESGGDLRDQTRRFFPENWDTLIHSDAGIEDRVAAVPDDDPHARSIEAATTIRARQWLQLLESPIYLHLYVTLSINRGLNKAKVSIDGLVREYVQMLLGDWQMNRSVAPFLGSDDFNSRDVHSSLNLLGFKCLIDDHVFGRFLDEQSAYELLKEFHSFSSEAKDRHVDRIRNTFRVLQEANLIESLDSEKGWLRFHSPHEMFAVFFASRFASMADESLRTRQFNERKLEKEASTFATLLRCASYSRFLENPALRFLEDAVVLGLQSQGVSATTSTFAIQDQLETALDTPPIAQECFDSGITRDELEKIFPANLLMLGRVFSSAAMIQNYPTQFAKVKEKLLRLYLNTNLEFVFQAIGPIVSGEAWQPSGPVEEDPESFAWFDQEWRLLNSCPELTALASRIDQHTFRDAERSAEVTRDILKRRIAYKMGYHARTFRREDFEWIKKQVEGLAEKNDEQRIALLLGTLRRIYDDLPSSKSELKHDVKTYISSKHRPSSAYEDAISEAYQGADSLSAFFEAVLKNQQLQAVQFELSPLLFLDRMHRLIVKNPEHLHGEYERISAMLYQGLKEAQERRKNASYSDLTQFVDNEARVVRIIGFVADSVFGQQYLVPKECALPEIIEYPSVKTYDRTDLLKRLFAGASQAVGSDSKQFNDVAYSVGGWQLYDYYSRTLWKVLRYASKHAYYLYID